VRCQWYWAGSSIGNHLLSDVKERAQDRHLTRSWARIMCTRGEIMKRIWFNNLATFLNSWLLWTVFAQICASAWINTLTKSRSADRVFMIDEIENTYSFIILLLNLASYRLWTTLFLVITYNVRINNKTLFPYWILMHSLCNQCFSCCVTSEVATSLFLQCHLTKNCCLIEFYCLCHY